MSVAAVNIQDAVAGYGDRHVLRGVDLSVDPGQAVALLGANGSGKSTLVRSALGLVRLSRGEVTLFGTALERFRQWRCVGFVPQRLTAGGGVPATAGEVVMAGRLSHRRLLWPASARDRRVVTESLDAVGLADRAGDAVATLSGGQQQRVLIARALATEPDLLVMDEPTAGVDAENAELLAELLRRRRAAGAAILLVAHELGPLAELIDEAVVLSHGTVVHRGAVPRLVDSAGEHPHDAATATLLWSVA